MVHRGRGCAPLGAHAQLRRIVVKHLLWFLEREKYAHCDVTELRAFFVYMGRSHKDAAGRWGNPRQTAPLKPRTIKDYQGALRTLFRWIVAGRAV